METERLYYRDCYLKEFDATVVDASADRTIIYLDRTAFYPTSGGQPFDGGTFNEIEVLEVSDADSRIAHKLAAPLVTDQVHGRVDWMRRYDHMQQHTGQHLLSAVFADLFGYQTVSFHLGAEVSTIELDASEVNQSTIEAAEKRAAELIGQAVPVRIQFVEASEAQGLRKASLREGSLRVVEIGNVDRSACGGTHVASTAELGLILIRRQEKLRGHVRLEFVCGTRSLQRAQKDFQILSQMARLAGAPIETLPTQFESLKERLAQAEKERQRFSLELAKQEGRAHWNATACSTDGLRRMVLPIESLDEKSRVLAQAFTENGKAAILLISQKTGSVLLAVSSDANIDAGKTLREALAHRGGRGGGSRLLAQGSLPDQAYLNQLGEELGFVRSQQN